VAREIGPTYEFSGLTQKIIGSAFEVHRNLGSGFLERVYANSLVSELAGAGLIAKQEVPIQVRYKGVEVGLYYADVLVDDTVICEVKAIRSLLPEHEAQLIHYLKATGMKVGLLLNFGSPRVQVKRLVY
jgi:GxxExxY protein